MRTLLLGAVMSVATMVACLVDRTSEAFECTSQAQCDTRFPDDDRQCTGGYCIVPDCPDDCTSCDETTNVCNIDCTSVDECFGTITCPPGWHCLINCDGDGACNDISCESGSECDIVCTGFDACGDVTCDDACRCDVTCDELGGACDSMTCPTIGNGANQVRCTTDGTVDGECDSARAPGCARC